MTYSTPPRKLFRTVQKVSEATGQDFLRCLARMFADTSGMDCFFVGRLAEDLQKINTFVLFDRNRRAENVSYPLPGTPCETVCASREMRLYPENLGQNFPLSFPFDFGTHESYCGVPLFDTRGNLLGLMAVLSRRPLARRKSVEALMRFFAARVAGELERLQAEETLLEQLRFSQTVLDAIPAPIFSKDEEGRYLGCNRAFEGFIGYPRAEIIGKTVFDVAPKDLAKVYHLADLELLQRGGTQTYEAAVVAADGDCREVLFQKAVFSRKDGKTGGLVGTMVDITERKKAEREAQYLTHFDPLTNLPNQVLFIDRLNMEIASTCRLGKKLAILCIDLDHFKKVNNAFGHARGDEILQRFAKRMSAFLRENDTISRMGGDSFNLLLPDIAHESKASLIAKRLLDAIRQPFLVEDHEVFLHASIGIAIYPNDGTRAGTLLKHADLALSQAKEKGRNHHQFFADEMNFRAEERLVTECQLRKAMERAEFTLHYQPQIDSRTMTISGVEALVRWRHPTKGLLLPNHFITLAEETGLIVPLGQWVLKAACRQARAWKEMGLPPLRIGVNLSPKQFQQSDLFETIRQILLETGLDPTLLNLEITESAVMTDIDHAIQILTRLKSLGVQLSIDDFGTGYSSLNHLKNLPIDTLKIDRSFVMEIPEAADDMAIVSAVISMAHNLNLKVLAEGVQSLAQRDFLLSNRCDELQGYLFGRPLDATQFQNLDRHDRSVIEPTSLVAARQPETLQPTKEPRRQLNDTQARSRYR